ncbi:SOS response-associated peptidase family protein [Pseudomonas sp. GCM10022186]|uniref:SOS response-associated peptidase family protein n=1 Tax=Pseudomonas sp. GCM10022186 TaxID=3252650 RepID=UPI003618D968
MSSGTSKADLCRLSRAISWVSCSWRGADGEDVLSCELLTKQAVGPVSAVHHRMPVILAPEQFDLWLSPDTRANPVSGELRK